MRATVPLHTADDTSLDACYITTMIKLSPHLLVHRIVTLVPLSLLVLNILFIAGYSLADTGEPVVSSGPVMISLNEEERKWVSDHPEITVSNEFDWPPFDFVLTGKPQGFGIDLMNILSERSGLKFRYVNGYTWDELVDMFFRGEIDLLHSLSMTPERAEKAFFSPPYYHSKNVLILRSDAEQTNDLHDLEGKIIALPKGWSSIEFFRTYYPQVHIIEVESTRQALEYVDQGKVFATVEQEGIAGYFVKKFGFTDLVLSAWIEDEELQRTSSMHFAVLRENPVLFSILEKALFTIQPEDMNELTAKWFSRAGRNIGSEDVGLTPNERQYLDGRESITFCIDPSRMPLEGVVEGTVSGMSSDFIEMYSERLGVAFEYIPTSSWRESVEAVREGRCDILPMANESGMSGTEYIFTTPYLSYGVAIVAREEQPFIGGMNDLAGLKVAVPAGGFIEETLTRRFPSLDITSSPDAKDCLLLLASGSVDAVLLSIPVATYHIRHMGLTELKLAGYAGFKDNIRVATSIRDSRLHSVMSKLVRSIPMKDIEEVSQKWISLKFEHRVDYRILLTVVGVVLLFAGMIILWNYQLVRLNRKLAAAHSQLEEKSRELEQLSITDTLTGLYNRRYLESSLQREIDRQQRYRHGLSVILIDLDYFKEVNDRYGHNAGDMFLVTFAGILLEYSRKSDILGRWGGEEFVVICPENSEQEAAAKAEHLRRRLAETVFDEIARQTASFGVAEWEEEVSVRSLIDRADSALYKAKEEGRNRVEVFSG